MPVTVPDLKQLLERPVAYHRIFAAIGGGASAGLMLSQAMYWTSRTQDATGWFYKTATDWEFELGLSRWEVEGARRKLRTLGLLREEKRGIPMKIYYRLELEALAEAVNGYVANPQDWMRVHNMRKNRKQTAAKPQPVMRKTDKLYKEAETTQRFPETTPNPGGAVELVREESFAFLPLANELLLNVGIPGTKLLHNTIARAIAVKRHVTNRKPNGKPAVSPEEVSAWLEQRLREYLRNNAGTKTRSLLTFFGDGLYDDAATLEGCSLEDLRVRRECQVGAT